MQVLAPLLDASGRPGTVGQLLSSNGSVAAPGWRPAPAATDGLRVSLAAGTPYAAGDQLAKAVLYLTPTAGGQAVAFDLVDRPTTVYAAGGASFPAAGNVPTAARWYDVFECYDSGGLFGVRGRGVMSAGGTGAAAVALPANAAGDLLVAAYYCDATATPPAPAGWTLRGHSSVAGSPTNLVVATKVSAGNEAAVAFADNGQSVWRGIAYAAYGMSFEAAVYNYGSAGYGAPALQSAGLSRTLFGFYGIGSGAAGVVTPPPPQTPLAAAGVLAFAAGFEEVGFGYIEARIPAVEGAFADAAAVSFLLRPATEGVFLELSAPYSAAGVPADAVARNATGVAVKTADPTRKLVGTVYAPTATTFEDSLAFPLRRVNFPSRANYAFDARGFCAVDALVADRLSPAAAPEQVVLGATALGAGAFGGGVACGGTAPYTVALPSPAGRAGGRIGFRMAAALAAVVTLDAGAGVLIGKARTLGLWLLEAVVLVSDGANWFIESGWRRPMSARYYLTAALTATAGLDTAVPVSSRDYDVSGLMGYSAARPGGVQAPRAGLYQLVMKAMVQGVGGGGVANTMTLNVFVQKNAPSVSISTGVVAFMNTPIPQYQFGTATLAKRLQLAAGDYLHLGVTASGTGVECNPGMTGCYLELTEV